MREREKVRLLWLDDRISELSNYVAALEEYGFAVTTASSYAEAMSCLERNQFDVILADIRMEAPNGIAFLRDAHRKLPDVPCGVFSSYLYLSFYREELRRSFPIELIEKRAYPPRSKEFEDLVVNPLRRLVADGATRTIQAEDSMAKEQSGVDPFSIELDEFMAKPMAEKVRLTGLAEKKASKLIERCFSEGKIWVMLCGDARSVRASATHRDEVLSNDEVMQFAAEQGRAPFIFRKPVDVDDIGGWSVCGATCQLEYYPTVTLDFGRKQVNVHFDTGCGETLFSYEELVDMGAITESELISQCRRFGIPYFYVDLLVEANMKDQRNGQTRLVQLRGQAVLDWETGPFRRLCQEVCPIYPEVNQQNPRNCPEHMALIGRNLLTENKIALILDGSSKQTYWDGQDES